MADPPPRDLGSVSWRSARHAEKPRGFLPLPRPLGIDLGAGGISLVSCGEWVAVGVRVAETFGLSVLGWRAQEEDSPPSLVHRVFLSAR